MLQLFHSRGVMLFLPLYLLLSLSYCLTSQSMSTTTSSHNRVSDPLKGKLVFSHVIYRHGDRTPIDPYPNDPWRKREFWTTDWGQLTNIGKNQHYELGQWLRQRYSQLLSATYSKEELYVRATDVDRTLMSALSNLAGLYPPQQNDVWNEKILWQPIPVHTIPEKMDAILAGKAPCPAYDYELAALQNTPEFRKLHQRFTYLYNYLTKYTGRTVDTLEGVQAINNTLFIEELKNKTLPEWTKKVYPSADMTYATSLTFAMYSFTRKLARLKTGPLIKEMLERFSKKALSKLEPDRKVWIYSAHDTTVANVLNTLKVFNLHSPPYAACIMLELRIDEQQKPFVSIFYRNTTAEPLPMYIPHCGIACPLEKMYEFYEDILPGNWEDECRLTMLMTYEDANMSMALGMLAVFILIMLILSYAVVVHYRRRNYRKYSTYARVA